MSEFSPKSEELFDETIKAYFRITKSDLIMPSEVFKANELAVSLEDNLYISSELNQVTGAYKIRGAYNKITSLTEKQKRIGIITASAGNHSQAVALLANELEIPATIIMPETTPEYKVARVKEFASKDTQIVLEGSNYDEAEDYAKLVALQDYLTMIHPFDDIKVMAGQGTWALEVLKNIKDIDSVYIPVGGGGLVTGFANILKRSNPDIRIVAVEPSGAASLSLAIEADKPASLEEIDTFVDGASVKRIGQLVFEILSENNLVDDVITVTNAHVKMALNVLREGGNPVKSELAGALSYAGYIKDRNRKIGQNVLCLVTGGNISQQRFLDEIAI